MKKHFLYYIFIASSVLAFTACADEDGGAQNNGIQRSPIALTVGSANGNMDGSGTTRAVTVNPAGGLTSAPFAETTSLYMVMKSEAADKTTLYTVTKGKTQDAVDGANPVSFAETGCTRYWDDAYARDAKVSVFAICAPGCDNTLPIGGKNEYPYTSMPTTGAWSGTAVTLQTAWSVSASQDEAAVKSKDLCYSNNVSKYEIDETQYDERLHFDNETKKFTAGCMNFYHALSKITFVIRKGPGFEGTASDFQFAEGTNITMKDMNLSNTVFDIVTGEFTGTMTPGNITKMYQSASTASSYTLDALVLPGTDMDESSTTDAISFTINNNKYALKKSDLLAQISDADKTNKMVDGSKLKAGVHYTFTLTVGKTRIEKITAKLVDWETVTASATPENARITIAAKNAGSAVTSGIDLYRLKDSGNTEITDDYVGFNYLTDYVTEDKATMSYEDNLFKTQWYWQDNTSYYHFRVVNENQTVTKDDGGDYISLASAEPTYTDVKWGAPFKTEVTMFQYNTTNGFDKDASTVADQAQHDILRGVGVTKSVVNLTMFHMMSDVTFKVKSVSGDAAVTLENAGTYTKIELRNIRMNGKALMGNGLVSTTSGATNWTFTQTPTSAAGVYSWTSGIVPQSLSDVQLVITTPDKNEYIIDLKDVVATSKTSNNITYPAYADNKVDYWYPACRYTYTFTLSKTKIENITATILNWEDVVAVNDNVQIR